MVGAEPVADVPAAGEAPIQRPAGTGSARAEGPEPLPPPVEETADSEPEPEPAPESVPTAGMEPIVASSSPVEAPPPAPAEPASVPLPSRTGRGLMIGSVAAGIAGWGFSLGTVGLTYRDCPGLLGCSEEAAVLIGFRWMANGAALGLAIPGAIYRGRYDAIEEQNTGKPSRNIDAYIKGGAAALGVGVGLWTLMRVSLFTFLPSICEEGPRCGTGYFLGLQAGWAMAATGAGLLSYGLAHREQRHKLGITQLRITPQLSADYSGLALGGRF